MILMWPDAQGLRLTNRPYSSRKVDFVQGEPYASTGTEPGSWRIVMAPLSPSPSTPVTDRSIGKFFSRLRDPRRARRRLHHLQDSIVIALCAVSAGAQDWQQIATFGRKRSDWLRGLLELPNGVPSQD